MSDVAHIQPRLVVLEGQSSGEEHPILEGRNMVGWPGELSVDIPLDDPDVSAEHARITFEDNQLFIQDLYSNNGTSVNGHRLAPGTRYPLSANAIIQIGGVRLQVRM